MLLSAALIVKNEERCLETCLASLQAVVDEIVVVDTGSTDRTGAIARQYGARLHTFEWVDDFAAARNHALSLVSGQWILYIDADERLRPCSSSDLRAQLADPSSIAYHVLLHPRPGFTPYWEVRLFRNDPQLRFRGVIHETLWPALHAYRAAHDGTIGRSNLVFDHEGYEGDQHHKHSRNLPLLQKALAEDPSRVFSWCHLAKIYAALGEDDLAVQAWQSGLKLLRQKRRWQAEDSLPYIGLIQWQAARGEDAESLLTEAMHAFPHHHHLQWLRGSMLMSAGRFAEAIPNFERLIAAGESGALDQSMSYDVRLFNVSSYASLATCHFQLGQYAESRRYFALAARHAPDELEYRVKGALASCLERRQDGVAADGA